MIIVWSNTLVCLLEFSSADESVEKILIRKKMTKNDKKKFTVLTAFIWSPPVYCFSKIWTKFKLGKCLASHHLRVGVCVFVVDQLEFLCTVIKAKRPVDRRPGSRHTGEGVTGEEKSGLQGFEENLVSSWADRPMALG